MIPVVLLWLAGLFTHTTYDVSYRDPLDGIRSLRLGRRWVGGMLRLVVSHSYATSERIDGIDARAPCAGIPADLS